MPGRDQAQRDQERENQLWTHTLENHRDLNDRVYSLEREIAIIKVKFALVGALLGIASSAVTTIFIGVIMKFLNLK